jgi:prepilin-type N-terminal cleavage/methylation domain-containing protein
LPAKELCYGRAKTRKHFPGKVESPHAPKAFTLIELLVVIAIIAIPDGVHAAPESGPRAGPPRVGLPEPSQDPDYELDHVCRPER